MTHDIPGGRAIALWALLLSVILAALKFAGMATLSWFAVASPVLIGLAILLAFYLVLLSSL